MEKLSVSIWRDCLIKQTLSSNLISMLHNKSSKIDNGFKYFDKDEPITFSMSKSIDSAKLIVECFKNHSLTDLIDSFTKENGNTDNHLISESSFLKWINKISNSNIKVIAPLLKLFRAFTSEENKLVDNVELLGGILCYFVGSKSQKLSFAFKLFEDNEDGTISRRKLWRLLRSFIRGLSLITDFTLNADEVSVIIVAKIFKYFEEPRFITLEDLSNWYLFSGNEISFWLELLDVNKWVNDY